MEQFVVVEEVSYEKWKTRFYLERGAKASAGMLGRVKEGWYPGPAPIGYLNDDTHLRAGIVLDPVKAPLVRRVFELIASGKPPFEVRKEITSAGLLAKNGKPLTPASFTFMIGNPFYYGLIRHKENTYPGKHEPIISQELFEAVAMKATRR